jgi:hypothetical protein
MRVVARDRYTFWPVASFKHWLAGIDFLPQLPQTDSPYFGRSCRTAFLFDGMNGAIQLQTNAAPDNDIQVIAALKLPQGATITDITIYGHANSGVLTNGWMGVARYLHSLNPPTAGESLISTASASPPFPTILFPSTLQNTAPITVPIDQNLTIDNETYKYHMMFRVTHTGSGVQLFIHSVVVTYSLPYLAPA